MKAKAIFMPKLSPTMREAVLVAWNKEIGELVKCGEVLFKVEANDAICEIEATADGVLDKMCFDEGDRIKPGELVAVLLS